VIKIFLKFSTDYGLILRQPGLQPRSESIFPYSYFTLLLIRFLNPAIVSFAFVCVHVSISTDLGKSCKLKFRFSRSGKSWNQTYVMDCNEKSKVNQTVATFLTHCTGFWPLYRYALS